MVAALNALRYFSVKTTGIGTSEWERLVDRACCRHGGAIGDEWMTDLGLRRRSIRVGHRTLARNLPAMIDVLNPHVGTALHSVLVVGSTKTSLDLVNYRWLRGPVVERVRWNDLPLMPPGNVNRRAWKVGRIEGHP